MRVELNASKLVPCGSDKEKNHNVLWNTVNCNNVMNSPLSGVYYGVLASFQKDGGYATAKLSPVYGSYEGSPLFGIPPDHATILRALNWLDPNAAVSPESTLSELGEQFLSCLNNSPIPNGTVGTLTDFIQSRSWDETNLWGGTMTDFWNLIESTEEEKEKWRILRLFITCNFAWQTKLIYFPSDALHREATSALAFNGLYLPQSNEELKNAVTNFSKNLIPADEETHSQLCIQREDGQLTPIDCSVQLWYCIPSVIDADFCLGMQSLSASSQNRQEMLSAHTLLNLLGVFLDYFQVARLQSLSYLYYPGDSSKGIEATLCGEDKKKVTRETFRSLMIDNGFCNSESWDSLDERIQSSFPNCWDENKENTLSNVYIAVWLEKFSIIAYELFRRIIERHPNFKDTDPNLHLGFISELTLQEFQRMFQSNTGSPGLRSYQLDAHQLPGKPIVFNIFKKRGKLDIIAGDPYKKPTGRTLHPKRNEYFPPSLVEFVWFILFAHLSEASFNSISLLTKSPTTPQVTSTNDEIRDLARRYVRCVLFSIHASYSASAKCWQFGYFPKDRTSAKEKRANKMPKDTQIIFLMMSAISETCPFFHSIGINPDLPDLTRPICNSVHPDFFQDFEKVLQDPVLMYTYSFCYQVFHQEETFEDRKGDCRKFIETTLKSLTGANLSVRSSDVNWIGHYTLGGSGTFSMSADPEQQKKMSHQQDYLLVVLGDERYNSEEPSDMTVEDRPVTNRIHQFAKWGIHYSLFFECLENSLRKKPSVDVEKNVQDLTASVGVEYAESQESLDKQPSTAQLPNDIPQGQEDAGEGELSDKEFSLPGPVQGDTMAKMLHDIGVLDKDGGLVAGESIDNQASTVQADTAVGTSTNEGLQEFGLLESADGVVDGGSIGKHTSTVQVDTAGGTTTTECVNPNQGVENAHAGESSLKPSFAHKSATGGVISWREVEQSNDSDSASITRNRRPKDSSGKRKSHYMSLKDVSKSLKSISPEVIDLTNDSLALEANVAHLRDEVKNQCLIVFFKFLTSHKAKLLDHKRRKTLEGKVGPPKRKRSKFIDDEAVCGDKDISSDEVSDEESSPSTSSFIDNKVDEETYDPAHRLVGHTSEVAEVETTANASSTTVTNRNPPSWPGKVLRSTSETPANVPQGTNTQGYPTSYRGKRLHRPNVGKRLVPPHPNSSHEDEDDEDEDEDEVDQVQNDRHSDTSGQEDDEDDNDEKDDDNNEDEEVDDGTDESQSSEEVFNCAVKKVGGVEDYDGNSFTSSHPKLNESQEGESISQPIGDDGSASHDSSDGNVGHGDSVVHESFQPVEENHSESPGNDDVPNFNLPEDEINNIHAPERSDELELNITDIEVPRPSRPRRKTQTKKYGF